MKSTIRSADGTERPAVVKIDQIGCSVFSAGMKRKITIEQLLIQNSHPPDLLDFSERHTSTIHIYSTVVYV